MMMATLPPLGIHCPSRLSWEAVTDQKGQPGRLLRAAVAGGNGESWPKMNEASGCGKGAARPPILDSINTAWSSIKQL